MERKQKRSFLLKAWTLWVLFNTSISFFLLSLGVNRLQHVCIFCFGMKLLLKCSLLLWLSAGHFFGVKIFHLDPKKGISKSSFFKAGTSVVKQVWVDKQSWQVLNFKTFFSSSTILRVELSKYIKNFNYVFKVHGSISQNGVFHSMHHLPRNLGFKHFT